MPRWQLINGKLTGAGNTAYRRRICVCADLPEKVLEVTSSFRGPVAWPGVARALGTTDSERIHRAMTSRRRTLTAGRGTLEVR